MFVETDSKATVAGPSSLPSTVCRNVYRTVFCLPKWLSSLDLPLPQLLNLSSSLPSPKLSCVDSTCCFWNIHHYHFCTIYWTTIRQAVSNSPLNLFRPVPRFSVGRSRGLPGTRYNPSEIDRRRIKPQNLLWTKSAIHPTLSFRLARSTIGSRLYPLSMRALHAMYGSVLACRV